LPQNKKKSWSEFKAIDQAKQFVRSPFSILTFELHPAALRDFCARTTGLHMILSTSSSGTANARQLFKGSKEAASILVCTRKNIFWLGVGIFCEWPHKCRTLGHLGPLHLALGPNH